MALVVTPKYTPATQNWTLLRALKTYFPNATYLKDLLPHADSSVVFQNTLMPIHQVVAAHLAGGGDTSYWTRATGKGDYADSGSIHEIFVPKQYLDEVWGRVQPDYPPGPTQD